MLSSYEDCDEVLDSFYLDDLKDQIEPIENTGKCVCGGEYIEKMSKYICNKCETIAPFTVEEFISMVQKKKEGLDYNQRKRLYDRLKILNDSARSRGVDPMSDAIINTALDYFSNLREVTEETRTQKLMKRFAACLYYANMWHGSGKSPAEIQKFCMLDSNINKALELILITEKTNKKIVGLEKLDDTRDLHISGVLLKLKKLKPEVKELHTEEIKKKTIDLALYVFDISEEEYLICISSKYETKIAACTYIGLRLSLSDQSLVSIEDVSKASGISVNTIMKYVNGVKMNISLFPRLTA